MNVRMLVTFLIVIGSAATLLAEDMVSGPPAGTVLTSVNCYANSGPYAGQESFDAAAEVGQNPGAFLFMHMLDRNTAPVIRGVDNLFKELGVFGFKGFIVTIDGDRTSGEEMIKRVNGSFKLTHPLVLSLDGLDGPGNLALNRRCTLSLVVVNKGKVTQSIGFTDTGMHDLDRIRKAFEDTFGGIPSEPAQLLALAKAGLPTDETALRELAARQAVALYRANKKASEEHATSRRYPTRKKNMRAGAAPQRERMERAASREKTAQGTTRRPVAQKEKPNPNRRGGLPQDAQLNSLLRSYIRTGNTNERVDDVFASIQKRSKESDDLEKQSIAMFQLILSDPDKYGSAHAKKLAQEFLAERGEK